MEAGKHQALTPEESLTLSWGCCPDCGGSNFMPLLTGEVKTGIQCENEACMTAFGMGDYGFIATRLSKKISPGQQRVRKMLGLGYIFPLVIFGTVVAGNLTAVLVYVLLLLPVLHHFWPNRFN